MNCRPHCAACCIAPSISSPLPGMPNGKPAFEKCIHLDEQLACTIFGRPERPKICVKFTPTQEICGEDRNHAMEVLTQLEVLSRP